MTFSDKICLKITIEIFSVMQVIHHHYFICYDRASTDSTFFNLTETKLKQLQIKF